MSQLIFATLRAIKYIHAVVDFLTTRVQEPDEDDLRNLQCLLQDVLWKIFLPLIFRAGRINVINWWVDASYAVHRDMRGHTGTTMYLGRRPVISMSKRQKINM